MMFWQIPHAFAWSVSLAASRNIDDLPYIAAHLLLYTICFLADTASIIWRGYLLATCSGCSTVAVGFGWAVFAVVCVLDVIDFMSLSLSFIIKEQLSVKIKDQNAKQRRTE
jgi:hypothetical protein